MTIILDIFLLCITAVSALGQSQELNGIVGESVKFPTKVKTSGSLTYSSVAIGRVLSGDLLGLTDPEYKGRVQWDRTSGLFSLSDLKVDDSGEYKVQDTDLNINTVFRLNVYKDNVPVSKPHVTITRNKYRCSILCSADRGTRATLTWYREGEEESYSSSDSLDAPYLKLPETVESGIYTCVARNSVSNETSDPLTVGAHCTAGAAGIWQAEGSKRWSLCLALIAMLCSRLV